MTARQFELAEGVNQIELRLQGIGAVQALRAHFQVAAVGLARRIAQRVAVVARHQAEARFDPALEHGPFATVGIETPAADDPDVVGLGPVFSVAALFATQAHLLGLLKPEMDGQVIAKDLGPRFRRGGLKAPEEILVQFGHAIEQQCRRVFLEGQAAEHDSRQVAAIDR